jgi:oxygen-independent coproporphyrinogen-3 oxidase
MEGGWGVYVHVPFCPAKCRYCGFHSLPPGPGDPDRYRRALGAEVSLRVPQGLPVESVYVGGGTPTILPPEVLSEFLHRLRARADLAGLREATVEANPATVDAQGLRKLREAGFDRLSLGVQSLSDTHLRTLGRAHAAGEAQAAFEAARSAGFPRISVDLIWGVPGQTMEELEEDLESIAGMGPEHVSAYQLTLVEGTEMHRLCTGGGLRAPGEEELVRMYRLVRRVLTGAGYIHYEVSSYAAGLGEVSVHNEACWRGAPYLGLGPSAHSFDGRRRRSWNGADTAAWAEALLCGDAPPGGGELLSWRQRATEMAMLGLRTAAGVDLSEVEESTGMRPAPRSLRSLRDMESHGLLRLRGAAVSPTPRGMLMADGIAAGLDWAPA